MSIEPFWKTGTPEVPPLSEQTERPHWEMTAKELEDMEKTRRKPKPSKYLKEQPRVVGSIRNKPEEKERKEIMHET